MIMMIFCSPLNTIIAVMILSSTATTTTAEYILLFVRSEAFGQALKLAFLGGGYHVKCVTTESEVIASVKEAPPVLVVMERLDNLYFIVRQLRDVGAVSIMVIADVDNPCSDGDGECSSDYDHEVDLVVCNQTPRQILARARAILRRRTPATQVTRHFRAGNIQMNLDRHEVIVNGRMIELTPKEFEILHQFIEAPGRVFSRQDMLNRVWGEGYALEEHALDVHIHSLRQKLEVHPSEPSLIMTVRGVGYKLRA